VTDERSSAEAKEQRLKDRLAPLDGLVIAFSAGVDSTYLADVAHEVLGGRMRLVIADSPSLPRGELAEAKALAAERGWPLEVVATAEFEQDDFLRNDALRCYCCKRVRFDALTAWARAHGVDTVAHGENADDALDPSRVGARAAAERAIIAPLQDAALTKAEIRTLSRRRGLRTSDKPSFACLATRIPTETRIDVHSLAQVEQAEETLKEMGFRQYRARHHGDLCRIEVPPEDFERFLDPALRARLLETFGRLGFKRVTLDLAGYRGEPVRTTNAPPAY